MQYLPTELVTITQEEALNNIQEAIELYLQPDAIDLLPGAVIREVMVG
ncbi:hypothetical protein O53_3574 [Microcystis aeruginosa TAIHU98]|jgi:predicted RNase H-like HicB family nuclease|uniref:Uncharacterized protein n=2 Tax=Microcystis aeruginosa TaxID=1126 RepID=L7E6T6_MICAE|nr:hypothetical protein [Microcystis aeruginosa]ELP54749.1 hypothetical protein O53_3574 [Microcystis aeruginosa TAIHU98]GCE62755.1 hypothetical protein MiAbB_04705 [Microcystis aeruginosa NIES-4285]